MRWGGGGGGELSLFSSGRARQSAQELAATDATAGRRCDDGNHDDVPTRMTRTHAGQGGILKLLLLVGLFPALCTLATGSGGRAKFTPPPPPTTPEELFVEHARQGRFAEVRELHASGVHPDVFSDTKGPGYTALHWAALNGNPKMAAMLIKMGANINARHKSVREHRAA